MFQSVRYSASTPSPVPPAQPVVQSVPPTAAAVRIQPQARPSTPVAVATNQQQQPPLPSAPMQNCQALVDDLAFEEALVALDVRYIDTHCHVDLVLEKHQCPNSMPIGDFQRHCQQNWSRLYGGCITSLCFPTEFKRLEPFYNSIKNVHTYDFFVYQCSFFCFLFSSNISLLFLSFFGFPSFLPFFLPFFIPFFLYSFIHFFLLYYLKIHIFYFALFRTKA